MLVAWGQLNASKAADGVAIDLARAAGSKYALLLLEVDSTAWSTLHAIVLEFLRATRVSMRHASNANLKLASSIVA